LKIEKGSGSPLRVLALVGASLGPAVPVLALAPSPARGRRRGMRVLVEAAGERE
jgi:hypothetical protein